MITYPNAIRCPEAFLNVFGCSIEAFDVLFTEFAVVHERRRGQSSLTRKAATPRKRKPGAGRRFKHSLQDRLLLALFWLRVRPTLELLGFFFSLDKTSAEDNLKDVLETLKTMTLPTLVPPGPCTGKLRTPEQGMRSFPGLAQIIGEK